MDAAQRGVHAAAVEVLGRAGFGVCVQPEPGCCGALAEHRGLGRRGHLVEDEHSGGQVEVAVGQVGEGTAGVAEDE